MSGLNTLTQCSGWTSAASQTKHHRWLEWWQMNDQLRIHAMYFCRWGPRSISMSAWCLLIEIVLLLLLLLWSLFTYLFSCLIVVVFVVMMAMYRECSVLWRCIVSLLLCGDVSWVCCSVAMHREFVVIWLWRCIVSLLFFGDGDVSWVCCSLAMAMHREFAVLWLWRCTLSIFLLCGCSAGFF